MVVIIFVIRRQNKLPPIQINIMRTTRALHGTKSRALKNVPQKNTVLPSFLAYAKLPDFNARPRTQKLTDQITFFLHKVLLLNFSYHLNSITSKTSGRNENKQSYKIQLRVGYTLDSILYKQTSRE